MAVAACISGCERAAESSLAVAAGVPAQEAPGSADAAVEGGELTADWRLSLTSERARAAVFVSANGQRVVAVGDLLPGSPWRLQAVGQRRAVLGLAETAAAARLHVELAPGALVPAPPAPTEPDAEAIPVSTLGLLAPQVEGR